MNANDKKLTVGRDKEGVLQCSVAGTVEVNLSLEDAVSACVELLRRASVDDVTYWHANALEKAAELTRKLANNRKEREDLMEWLNGLKVYGSQGRNNMPITKGAEDKDGSTENMHCERVDCPPASSQQEELRALISKAVNGLKSAEWILSHMEQSGMSGSSFEEWGDVLKGLAAAEEAQRLLNAESFES